MIGYWLVSWIVIVGGVVYLIYIVLIMCVVVVYVDLCQVEVNLVFWVGVKQIVVVYGGGDGGVDIVVVLVVEVVVQ